MIKKNIRKRFSRDYTNVASLSDAVDQAKRELVWEIMKGIAPNTDYLFRLDTYTSTDPYLDEIVFDAQCKAEEAHEFPILSRCITVPRPTNLPWPRDALFAVGDAPKQTYLPEPKTVIFHPPATIVYWEDGEKTIVKCMDSDEFSPEVGLAMCLAKYIFGKRYKKWFRDALKKGGWDEHRHDENPQAK